MGDLRGAQANSEEEKATGEVHVPAHEKIRTRCINHVCHEEGCCTGWKTKSGPIVQKALEKDDQWDRS
eukprot:2868580-Pyramimonas_sp.AAC.1